MRSTQAGAEITPEQYRVLASCQKVWHRNVFWSFLYLQSRLFSSPNSPVVQDDVLTLADQYGSLLGQYYGYDAGRLFCNNTYEYLRTYVEYVNSMAQGNGEESDAHLKLWNSNAELVINQLCELNAHWRELEWRGMLTQEMQILKDAAARYLEGQYDDLSFLYDVYANIASEIAEYMAVGMIKQFVIR